jgi:signal transduction histidine kinase
MFSNTYLLLSLYFEFDKGVYFMLLNVVGFLLLPFLVKTKLPIAWIGNLYVSFGASAVVSLAYYSGGIYSALYPWIVSVPILALLIVSRGAGYFWGTVSFVIMMSMGIATIHGFEFPVEYNENLRAEWITAIIPGLLLISLFIAIVFEYAQKRALQQLVNKNRQLVFQNDTITIQSEELANLVEDKDYIIRILAHDLRSPLKNISTLIKLMDIEPEEGRRQEVLDIINRTASDAENLVNKVLQMDRSQQTDFQPQIDQIKIFSFLQLMADKMQGLANKKIINIDLAVTGAPSMVKADSTYLNLIFENLISNAIKFSPVGSTIQMKAISDKKHVKITILDEGPGIATNEIPLLFKKFSKLSPRPTAGESSTGLGLALVKRYTELVDGEVYYDQSYDGQGASFVMVLPILTS